MQSSEVNDYIKRQIQVLKGASRDNAWKRFQEGFKGYTVNTFKLAHRITLRDLHNLLASYGVPVDTPRRGLSCADALQAFLEKKLPEELILPPEPQPTNRAPPNPANRAPPNSANQASLQPQYSIEPPSVQPQSRYQSLFVQPKVQSQSQYQALQPQASTQRSVQYNNDNNWSWPLNKQEQ